MSFFNSLIHKGEVKLEFEVDAREIKPWPLPEEGGHGAKSTRTPIATDHWGIGLPPGSEGGLPSSVVLVWERGNKRSGSSKPASVVRGNPDDPNCLDGRLGRIQFQETFSIPATLRREESARGGRMWQKKCVVFAVHKAGPGGQPQGAPYGRAVLDLADYGPSNEKSLGKGALFAERKGSLSLGVGKMVEKELASAVVGSEVEDEELGDGGERQGPHVVMEVIVRCFDKKGAKEREKAMRGIGQDGENALNGRRKSHSHKEGIPGGKDPTRPDAGAENGAMSEEDIINALLEDEEEEVAREEDGEGRSGSLGEDSRTGKEAVGGHTRNITQLREWDEDDEELGFSEDELRGGDKDSGTGVQGRAATLRNTSSSRVGGEGLRAVAPQGTSEGHEDGEIESVVAGDAGSLTCSNMQKQRGEVQITGQMASSGAGQLASPAPAFRSSRLVAVPSYPTAGPALSPSPSAQLGTAKVSPLPFGRDREQEVFSAVHGGTMDIPAAKPTEERATGRVRRNSKSSKKDFRAARVSASLAGLAEAEQLVAAAEERAAAANQKAAAFRAELVSAAALEVAIYACTPAHSGNACKVHTPARRLWRTYVGSRRANGDHSTVARNLAGGIVVALRASGDDVPRLVFWWSNCVALREMVAASFPGEIPPGARPSTTPKGEPKATSTLQDRRVGVVGSHPSPFGGPLQAEGPGSRDWSTAGALCAALLRVEAYTHGKVLQQVWWQVMAPPMRLGSVKKVGDRGKGYGDGTGSDGEGWPGFGVRGPSAPGAVSPSGAAPLNVTPVPKSGRTRGAMGGMAASSSGGQAKAALQAASPAASPPRAAPGSTASSPSSSQRRHRSHAAECTDMWKGMLMDVRAKLCPARHDGRECGCIQGLGRLILSQCIQRLDVALFNALLRDPATDPSMDPASDPVSDPDALPIESGKLTFEGGMQLKMAITVWTDWLSELFSTMHASSPTDSSTARGPTGPAVGSSGAAAPMGAMVPFSLLRATADLLMLPKDMLMDRGIRQEVCASLSLPLIRRVLYLFVPDEHAPDPVPPSLLAAFNAEVSMEKRRRGETDLGPSYVYTASSASCSYTAIPSQELLDVIGMSTCLEDGTISRKISAHGVASEKSYASDDELTQTEQPLELVIDGVGTGSPKGERDPDVSRRYQMLREAWGATECS